MEEEVEETRSQRIREFMSEMYPTKKEKVEKTRSQRIREFMSEMDPKWNELDKFVYICNNVARLYEYKFGLKHAQAKKMKSLESYIVKREENIRSGKMQILIDRVMEGEDVPYIEEPEKVCISLSEICNSLARKVGLDAYTIDTICSDRRNNHVEVALDYKDENKDERVVVDMARYLQFAHTKSNPLNHNVFKDVSNKKLLEAFQKVGIDTSFPGSDLSELSEQIKSLKEKGEEPTKMLESVLKKVGERSRKYDMKLEGLSIEGYYNYLFRYLDVMRTERIPFKNKYGTDFEYVLVTGQVEGKKRKYTCFIFNKENLQFERIELPELCSIIKERKLSCATENKFKRFFLENVRNSDEGDSEPDER